MTPYYNLENPKPPFCFNLLILIGYVFYNEYNLYQTGIQLKEDYTWIAGIDFHWRLGVDGLSIGLVLLTGFITTLATLAAWPITRNPKLFYFLMLATSFHVCH